MSGHNKWSKIKNVKAKNEAANSKIFTKIGREIVVAVKSGGADPNLNPKLKNIIAKAKSYNMPSDNINRSIKRASGELSGVNYEHMTYEGYGPAGSAIIVEALTDNKNRTASDVRHLFDKFGGSLGSNGCVSYLFSRKGVIVIANGNGVSEDDVMMIAIDSGADDVVTEDQAYVVYTSPEAFDAVKAAFDNANIAYESAETTMIPSNYIDMPEEKMATFMRLIDGLEEDDDIQNVYHNVNLPDNDDEE